MGAVLPPAHRDRELREIAEGPLRHEVETMCAQVQELRGWAASGAPMGTPAHDALLEAPLLHFLVLDDFLGTPPVGEAAVGAEQYHPGRSRTPVLTRQERLDLDAALALGRPRRPLRTWDHAGIAARLCEAFVGFAGSLERHPEPEVRLRAAWFAPARAVAHDLLLAVRSPTHVITLSDPVLDLEQEHHRSRR